MQLLNANGELPKGAEILLKQLCRMMGVDGDFLTGQITAILTLLETRAANEDKIIAQNDEILSLLKGNSNVKH